MRRVVVTGVGAVSPCGLDTQSTWEASPRARAASPITRFDATDLASQIAGEVKGFVPDRLTCEKRKAQGDGRASSSFGSAAAQACRRRRAHRAERRGRARRHLHRRRASAVSRLLEKTQHDARSTRAAARSARTSSRRSSRTSPPGQVSMRSRPARAELLHHERVRVGRARHRRGVPRGSGAATRDVDGRGRRRGRASRGSAIGGFAAMRALSQAQRRARAAPAARSTRAATASSCAEGAGIAAARGARARA